jgi:hypothetical protein
MSVFDYPKAPEGTVSDEPQAIKQAIRRVAEVVNRSLTGKLNALKEITLTANAASTVIDDARLTTGSLVLFDPVTSNAATELAAGTLYVTTANRRNGRFTVTHANNAQTDRTFKLLLIG